MKRKWCLGLVLAILVPLSLLCGPMGGKAMAADLELDDQQGRLGETVTFTVSVNNAPNEVTALGLDISYNSAILEYVGADFGGCLLAPWSFKQVSNPTPGQLKIGGFTVVDEIPPGASGCLVTLDFEVVGIDDDTLVLSELKDDIAGWTTRDGQFTIITDPPTVTEVNPDFGPLQGGQSVTIGGTGFRSGATVTFGGVAATGVTVVGPTQITCTTPAHEAGTVDVTVTNPDAKSGTLPEGYTYVPAPTVQSVDPNMGPDLGGQSVAIGGTGFRSDATVTFGGVAATGVTVVGPTQITCTTPAHTIGPADIVVTNLDDQSGQLSGGYTYTGAPAVTAVDPTEGSTAGGTPVTITGTNFFAYNGEQPLVTFGGNPATDVAVVSSTQITCETPAHDAGTVDVVVTNPSVDPRSDILEDAFTYIAPPTVAGVDPNMGPDTGGQDVTITGSDFQAGATVTFGGDAATAVTVVSPTQITCTTPAHATGAVDVVVTNPDGQSGELPGGYTYTGQPAITAIDPERGSYNGGTPVTITGSNFFAYAGENPVVTFDGVEATGVTVVSQAQVTCRAPAYTGPDRPEDGVAVDVVLTNPSVDPRSVTVEEGFTYIPYGITPSSATLRTGASQDFTVEGGQPPYRWSIVDDDGTKGSLSPSEGETVTYTAPLAPKENIQVMVKEGTPGVEEEAFATVDVYEDVAIPETPEGYDPDDPTTFPEVQAGASYDFTVSGGEGSSYTWTVDGPVVVNGGTGPSFQFMAPTEGAFAGVYTISVTDDQTGFSREIKARVPLDYSPESKNIREGKSFDLVLAGADPVIAQVSEGEFVEITPPLAPGETEDDIATVTPDLPIPFDAESKVTVTVTGADVDELRKFKIRATVTGDDDLTDENGLNVATTGWIRVMPVETFSGVVQDANDASPIANATIRFKLGDAIEGETTSDAAGNFSMTLLSPDMTGRHYNVLVFAPGYLNGTSTTDGWVSPETIGLTAETSSIGGKVTESDGVTPIEGAKVECMVDQETFVAYSDAQGDYTIRLPVDVATLPELEARASKTGYEAEEQDIKTVADFRLERLVLVDDVVDVPQDGGVIQADSTTVDIPAGALDGPAKVTVDPDIDVGDASPYTGNSTVLVEIKIEQANVLNPITVTMPFDTSEVEPGDFVNGNVVIWYAETADDLRKGNGTSVPPGDILYEDHLNGLVSFRVIPASVFGAGAPAAAPAGAEVTGGGGCFVAALSQGAPSGMTSIIILLLPLLAGWYMVRRKKG